MLDVLRMLGPNRPCLKAAASVTIEKRLEGAGYYKEVSQVIEVLHADTAARRLSKVKDKIIQEGRKSRTATSFILAE
jgi:hypothetical protein